LLLRRERGVAKGAGVFFIDAQTEVRAMVPWCFPDSVVERLEKVRPDGSSGSLGNSYPKGDKNMMACHLLATAVC
jgi:hypothetical protein